MAHNRQTITILKTPFQQVAEGKGEIQVVPQRETDNLNSITQNLGSYSTQDKIHILITRSQLKAYEGVGSHKDATSPINYT